MKIKPLTKLQGPVFQYALEVEELSPHVFLKHGLVLSKLGEGVVRQASSATVTVKLGDISCLQRISLVSTPSPQVTEHSPQLLTTHLKKSKKQLISDSSKSLLIIVIIKCLLSSTWSSIAPYRLLVRFLDSSTSLVSDCLLRVTFFDARIYGNLST